MLYEMVTYKMMCMFELIQGSRLTGEQESMQCTDIQLVANVQ